MSDVALNQKLDTSASRTHQAEIIMWAGILAVFAIAIIQRWNSLINHDVSWSLYMAQRMLAGEKIYVDLIEINPPLIFWLMSLNVLFSQAIGISVSAGLKLFVFASAAVSILLCATILKKNKITAWRAALVGITYALIMLPGSDFGQREHLLVIFVMPYLLLVVARRNGINVNVLLIGLVSLAAAIGICLKPYFVLIPAALEIYLLATLGWRRALFRPEQFLMVTLGLAYLASIFIFTPEYISRMVIYGISVYGIGYDQSFIGMLKNSPLVMIAAVAAFYWMRVRPNQKADTFIVVVTIAGAGLLLSFFLQAKGWSYQSYPVVAMVVVIGVALSARAFGNIMVNTKQKFHSQILLLPFFYFMLLPVVNYSYPVIHTAQWKSVINKYAGTNSLLIMSDKLFVSFPFVTDAGYVWASRFPSLWLSPGIAKKRAQIGGTTPLLDEIEAYNRRAMAEDIIRYKPQLVMIDVSDNKKHFGKYKFDYIADFSNDELFRAAWKKYRKMEVVSNFAIYQRFDAGNLENGNNLPAS